MKKTVNILRKVLALIIGVPLLIIGIILIPLPGPGLIISFIALFILSLEFDYFSKHYDKVLSSLKSIYDKSVEKYHERMDEIDKKL